VSCSALRLSTLPVMLSTTTSSCGVISISIVASPGCF
jgi:hypothetical protein